MFCHAFEALSLLQQLYAALKKLPKTSAPWLERVGPVGLAVPSVPPSCFLHGFEKASLR